MKKITNPLFYPFLFGFYPVLSLLGHNLREVNISDTARSFAVVFILVTSIFVLLRLLLRDWHRAGLLTTLVTLVFLSYGHVYNVLTGVSIFGVSLHRHRYLAPLSIFVIGVGAWLILKVILDPKSWTNALNIIALVSLVMPIYQVGSWEVQQFNMQARVNSTPYQVDIGKGKKPDIYYIILDAYTREDILQSHFNYDNSDFLKKLVERGFYVASCSMSNYAHTSQSLSSSLYMNYLQDLFGYSGELPAWKDSEVIRFLRSQGYTVVAFNNGFSLAPSLEADIFISRPNNELNKFEAMLAQSSMILLLTDFTRKFPDKFKVDPEYAELVSYRKDTLYFLDELNKLPDLPGPNFVFAHVFPPHDPFVFGPNGEFITDSIDPLVGYVNQVRYVNVRILDVIDTILAHSKTPPIIIVQGDHGPAGVNETHFERMSNLNAYYLPGAKEQPYASISPVNSFRFVFNQFFDATYDLLPDIRYYSKEKYLEDLSNAEIVPEQNPACIH